MTIENTITKQDLLIYKDYLKEQMERHGESKDVLDHQMYLMETHAYYSFVAYWELEDKPDAIESYSDSDLKGYRDMLYSMCIGD